MIYWFTGQPCSGKTTLANMLKDELDSRGIVSKRIDGDDLRALINNSDYSKEGRFYNVDIAQKLSHYIHSQGEVAIVSLVSPYLEQRESFKKYLGRNIVEIYTHTSEERERDMFKVVNYQSPKTIFIDIDTTTDSPKDSISIIIKKCFSKQK